MKGAQWWQFTHLILLGALLSEGRAADGSVVLSLTNASVHVKVDGDKDDDWWIQVSSNLTTWTTLPNLGPLLSGNDTNAVWRTLGTAGNDAQYYRALQTAGLYDPTLFRTVNLTFTQANWGTLLAAARSNGINVNCSVVTLNNGATNLNVGSRYKGNTSYTQAGTKKSINLEFDWAVTNADLMGFSTINLNNAAGDETIMREPLFFTIMSQYTPCPEGAMANVVINGSQWGVYSLVQQENAELIQQWFPSSEGDRWRAPNAAAGGGGGGGGFTSSNSAFAYFGNTNLASYLPHYELKTDNVATNVAWQRLINAIQVLNTTPTNQLRDTVENVFAVDDWLWMLAIENLFVDDDSYWNKGADYGFYYEVESGRIHPVEHDGNEAFTTTLGIDYTLSPVTGATGSNRPLLYRLLPINELRQRYLAHMRTVLEENFNPAVAVPIINQFHSLSINAILTDPNKGFTMAAYTNDLIALRAYVTNRHKFLTNHAELLPLQPDIHNVSGPTNTVLATNTPYILANVAANGASGLGSVWLYHRGATYGKFSRTQMFDDGAHNDGAAGDDTFGAATTNYPAGTKVRYYIEARGSNAAQAARFSPARAEWQTHSYRVAITTVTNSPVVLNEIMADNLTTAADPQGEYEDWIELRNLADEPVDLTGRYLSDDGNNPRKWAFPSGTTIPGNGYLIVWADEDTLITSGLHASFKLSKSGETIYLTDTDANYNAILDSVTFGEQTTDTSYGRTAADADVWATMSPTPGAANQ
jgi:hypothetical protein